jgi:hypoxanthine phosphoribosyltransferase
MPAIELRDTLLTEEAIRRRVEELAAEISREYAGKGELLLVGVLRGAFIFLADLARRLTVPTRIDFIALASYEATTETTGAVRLIMDVRADLAGRHVLIVEDIVDSGHTLRYLRQSFAARRPASLAACVLVRKPGRLEVEAPIEYLGFDIPDLWVVGYGLDCLDQHRALPFIAAVEPPKD